MIDHRSSFKSGNGCCNPADGELISTGDSSDDVGTLTLQLCAELESERPRRPTVQGNPACDQTRGSQKQLLLQLRLLNLHLSTRLFHIVSLPPSSAVRGAAARYLGAFLGTALWRPIKL